MIIIESNQNFVIYNNRDVCEQYSEETMAIIRDMFCVDCKLQLFKDVYTCSEYYCDNGTC